MKKLLLTLALTFTLLISCEKEETKPDKLDGIYVSETFKLADLDSAKLNLNIESDIIKEAFLININNLTFEVDSISDNIVIYFHFHKSYKSKVPYPNYYGQLEIEKTDSKMYRLIGYLNIYDPITSYDRWRYILYFN